MKKIIFILLAVVTMVMTSCQSKEEREKKEVEKEYADLFLVTDKFVDNLTYTYNSYGLFGGMDDATRTKCGNYVVMPVGRLINVKIALYAPRFGSMQQSMQDVARTAHYRELERVLTTHYKEDTRVNGVYICNGGTVMVDCRR